MAAKQSESLFYFWSLAWLVCATSDHQAFCFLARRKIGQILKACSTTYSLLRSMRKKQGIKTVWRRLNLCLIDYPSKIARIVNACREDSRHLLTITPDPFSRPSSAYYKLLVYTIQHPGKAAAELSEAAEHGALLELRGNAVKRLWKPLLEVPLKYPETFAAVVDVDKIRESRFI